MGLDEIQTQHAGLAFDVHSSLISIETVAESPRTLLLATRRIRQHIRSQDSLLLAGNTCALLLPATSFSGAQALAEQLSRLVADLLCEIRVYHGATALLISQRLRAAGAKTVAPEENGRLLPFPKHIGEQGNQVRRKDIPSEDLPYLAFLARYPSPRLLHLFPYELACLYQCIPIGSVRNMLTLATCHWLNREIIAQLRTATHRGIFQVRCEITLINEVLRYWQRLRDTADTNCSELEMHDAYSSSR